mgnify:CR=1 FL=1
MNHHDQADERIRHIARLAVEARPRLSATLVQTPLRQLLPNSFDGTDLQAWLKMECCQVSGSFKARGATHFLSKLLDEETAHLCQCGFYMCNIECAGDLRHKVECHLFTG